MPRGLPRDVKQNLEKCREAAIAAVDAYNRPGRQFRTGQYVILIVLAWTAVFHAIFYYRGQKPWYRRKDVKAVRYQRIDGEPKRWDLNECLRQYYGGDNSPVRQNLEFLIGLRNKIEHRYLPELDASLYGECQASLLNLEEMLIHEFGAKYALSDDLNVALQFSALVPQEKRRAHRNLARRETQTVREYVETFRGNLPNATLNSMKYSFNVYLVPKVANRQKTADAAIEFVKVDETSPEQVARLQKLNVLIKEKKIPIANLDLIKPKEVLARVQPEIPYRISMHDHTCAWRFFEVRPPTSATDPTKTKQEYCVYDEAHKDYLYTDAWARMLIRELSDEARFQEIVGRSPNRRS